MINAKKMRADSNDDRHPGSVSPLSRSVRMTRDNPRELTPPPPPTYGVFLAGLGGLKVGAFCVRVRVVLLDRRFTKPYKMAMRSTFRCFSIPVSTVFPDRDAG